MASGTAETSNRGDVNTDGWNEEEGNYEMRASSHQVAFTIDGSSVNKYSPAFKINEYYPQTGSNLTERTKIHARLDDSAASTVLTAQKGTNGVSSANTSGLTSSTGKRAGSMNLATNGDYLKFSTSDMSDWKQGTIEFWYKPSYDFNQSSPPTKYLFGTGASGVSGELYLKHEDSGSGYNRLIFGVYDEDGSPLEHTVEIRSSDYSDLWLANEWIEIRATWDANATTDNLKLYINGQYLTQYNTNQTAWTTFTPSADLYVGDYHSGGTAVGKGLFDDFYVHDDVMAGQSGAPVVLDSIYNTGTVTTGANSSTITGSGTSWLANLHPGQAIRVMADGDEQWYEIQSVEANTSLTLTRAYRGTGGSGKSYEAGGTPVVLPQLRVGGVSQALDTNYNIGVAGPIGSYIAQYLGTITTSKIFEFGSGLSTSTLTQNAYRFYDNTDVAAVTDPWPIGSGIDTAETTAVATSSGPGTGSVMRLRMSLQDGVTDLMGQGQAFKLQFAEGWVCSAVSQWFDVGATNSSTAAWRGYDNASVTDGAVIANRLLSVSDVNGSYVEANNSPTNPSTISPGQDAEWDWVLHANSINSNSSYCFRMVKSDGTALDTYTNYPRVNTTSTLSTLTQSRYRLYANTNAITPTDAWPVGGTDLAENTAASATNGPVSGNVLRLRMGITAGVLQLNASSQAFKLQFGSNATCSSVSAWQDVPAASSSTSPWRAYDNSTPTDGTTISSLLLSTATVGGSYVEANNSPNNPNAIPTSGVGEWDWAVEANSLSPATSYCFRMVKSDGSTLDTYSVYPQLTTTSTTFATTTFQEGNGENFVRTADAVTFDSTRDPGTGDTRHTTWFYFSTIFKLHKKFSGAIK
jgi:hypothetical protein